MIAVALVYLSMVATFGSLLTPFAILLSLPLAAIGAFPALAITGRELGLPSMLGLLMLIGIVVTNAIVMLEFVERLRREDGLTTTEALKLGAGTRFLMTAIAPLCQPGDGCYRRTIQLDVADAFCDPRGLQPVRLP